MSVSVGALTHSFAQGPNSKVGSRRPADGPWTTACDGPRSVFRFCTFVMARDMHAYVRDGRTEPAC
jgi:hypothetical protein